MNEKLELLKKVFHEYNYNKYKDIDLNSLICYVSNLLEANGIILTFENIYVGSYISFPLKFCLVEFPEFPDGARINRSILQCLPKYQNLLMGNAKKGYKLTTYGLIKAKDQDKTSKAISVTSGTKCYPVKESRGSLFLEKLVVKYINIKEL